MRLVCVFTAITAICALAAATCEADQLPVDKARQCSSAALLRYTTVSAEPAREVAQAAFDKCRQLWIEAVQTMVETSATPPKDAASRMIQENAALEQIERNSLRQWTVDVFDIRTQSAGK